MIGPLGYLAARSTRNRLVRQLRRLRTPRYALALLLGLAYLWYVGVRQRPASVPTGVSPDTVELLAAAGVTAILLWTWIFGADRRALAFSRAEVTWLFPAPVTRRQLIQYKLLRGQFVILFNVFLWTVLLSRGLAGAEPWRRAGAIWILLTTLALHRLGVALLRSSLLEHGRAAIRARAVTLILVGIVATAVLVDLIQAAPALGGAWDLGLKEFLAAAHEIAVRPVTATLLLPGRLLVRPMLAPSWAEWSRAILPATAILMVHYVWVIRSDAAFEESAAAAALARHRAGRRTGRAPRFTARPIPRLAPAGWPAGALLWKNLAFVVRTGRTRGTVLGFAAAALAVLVLSAGEGSTALLEIVGWLAAMWAGFLIVLGPQWVRNDLRTDLSKLALLRSYPLRGKTVVGAETAGSTAVLTALQLGLIGIAYLAFWGGEVPDPSPELRTAVLAAAVVFLPAINFLAMLIQNGAALLLPAWVRVGPDRPIGVEALGHNMLVMSGFVAILAGLLLAPAAVAGAVFLGLEPVSGWWAVAPAAVGALVVAALEARVLLSRLGRVFETTDPSAVPPAESG
ncbi:MAG TPA: putative ABC exporter domain-containing protein [Gemmatimonadales bacterium]|nr:putative ABC exporter domain-containing protein [Gemmatimonadales bacterium]